MNTLDLIRTLNTGGKASEDVLPVPDVYPDLSFDDYLAIPALNNSTLKRGYVSAKALKAALDGELTQERSSSLGVGSATHATLFEINDMTQRFAVEPASMTEGILVKGEPAKSPRATSEYKERRRLWEGTLPNGAEVITQSEWKKVSGMLKAVRSCPYIAPAIKLPGMTEVTLRWDETLEIDGRPFVVPMKMRADCLVEDVLDGHAIYDLKTTFRESPERWVNDALYVWRYHHQEATYLRGLRANGFNVGRMTFIVAQSEPPFDIYPVEFGRATRYTADRDLAGHLRMVAHGVLTEEWPGVQEQTYIGELRERDLAGDPHSLASVEAA